MVERPKNFVCLAKAAQNLAKNTNVKTVKMQIITIATIRICKILIRLRYKTHMKEDLNMTMKFYEIFKENIQIQTNF